MKKFVEISKDKTEVINLVISGSPIFTDKWLSFFPVGSEILFDNLNLSKQVVQAGIWTSGSLVYNYEIVRRDGDNLDIDRYPLSASGSIIFRGEINKNFPEHHLSGIPYWYN